MPQNIIDVSTFTDPIVAPVDGDAAIGASVLAGFQGLTNRTRYIEDQLAGLVESGNWTPVVATDATNAITHTSQIGRYVKIGCLVYITADIYGNFNASTGNVRINGAPFIFDHGMPAGPNYACMGVANWSGASTPMFTANYGFPIMLAAQQGSTVLLPYANRLDAAQQGLQIGLGYSAGNLFNFSFGFMHRTVA